MGATKISTKKLSGINITEVDVDSFRLLKNEKCRFVAGAPLDAGDVILLKASFKNPCECDDEEDPSTSSGQGADDSKVTYRRRIVPFVARAQKVAPGNAGRRTVTAGIENITPGDKKFFFDKFFSSSREERSQLDVEGRKIIFLA